MGRWTSHLSVGVVLLTIFFNTCYAETGNHCLATRASTCSACIQAGNGCAYCPDEIFVGQRCNLRENLQAQGCAQMMTAESTIETEKNEKINVLLKQSQVAPQMMSMSLMPGEERLVDLEVFEPTKGPLDLYILMDFSNSMSDDLANLKQMGTKLADLVGKLSDDYTIGFGKFVDKVVEPQTDMRPTKLKQPWPDSDGPFSFQHSITLTKDLNTFTQKLQKEKISGNLDAPEGGFDAILQTTVCKDQIGWRDHSTHLLVFSTESAFHYETDGANILSGILPRNDEQCHLDGEGKYTEDTRQDYPSVPTLVRLMGKHNIIPIFAVTNHSYSYYEKLHEYFPIAELGQLEENSENILNILEKAFENIRSKISIRAEDRPKAIHTEVLSATGSQAQAGTFKVKPGEIGKFRVRVKAQEKLGEVHVCEKQVSKEDKEGMMRVKPTTFSTALNIKASIHCPTCSCEKTPSIKAVRCHGNGDLVCGKCKCYDGWLGPFCNCSASVSQSAGACLAPGGTEACSGRGDCLCGTCICYNPEQYEGAFCQYDRSQCQRFGGFLCNDRGKCYMGECACEKGWEGPGCECSLSNQTCLDSKGGICNGRGVCKCGRCECQDSALPLSSTCEASFQAQGACEAKRSCVQCQAWKTGEWDKDKCDKCNFKVVMVDKLKQQEDVIEMCSFLDEADGCTYEYTVDYPEDLSSKELEVQVLKKKDCPPGDFMWLIPLIMFLMLLLGLLLLCCWKYCACCKACLALLPCCGRGRKVGFKEDQYLLRQSLLTSDHLDTPLVRTGPPKSTDVVRWKVTDNVHREANHPLTQVQPNPKETIAFPLSLRLNRLFSDTLSRPEARDTEALRREVDNNLNEVYKQIPGAQKVQKTNFRMQRNAGKRSNHTIVDTVLSAPRSAYPDIVKLTQKNVQSGNFQDLKVVPGYYTVATDREAAGAVELQEGVESVDVHVPLFIKDEDDEKKQLRVEAVDVPLGIAEITKRFVNITVIKEHAKSVLTFQQPAYSYSRQEGVVNIPVNREILEDGRTQVTYRSHDGNAKEHRDYMPVEGDLSFGPGETQKMVPVRLLELVEGDSLLGDPQQPKQFILDLNNPRQGAKLGRYPCTTVTITDQPEPSVVMFKKGTQSFTTSDPQYSIPVVRQRNQDGPTTVHWRTKKAQRFQLSGPLRFGPGETEKSIVIDPRSHPGPIQPENFQLELFDPSTNAVIGDRKTTLVNVTEGGSRAPEMATMQQQANSNMLASPGGRLLAPANVKAAATGPKNIHLNWVPTAGALGYKVRYWIYGDREDDAQVLDVKTNQAELTNLYPYCDYETRVCAYNAKGEGHYSDMVPCQTLEDVPSEPGRLAFNVISPTVTQVSWAEPAETNGIITAYEVIYTPINDDRKPVGAAKKIKIDNPKKRMLLIENLQSAQTYCYKVRAQNSIGWGPYRDATINLASQPTRPLSIPIIPDIPIIDAEAGDEYDGFLMYSSEVLKTPTGSKQPSVTDEDPMMNGKWDQSFLFPGGTGSVSHMSTSSYGQHSPYSTLSTGSNHRAGTGGVMNLGGTSTSTTTTTYLSGQGGNTYGRQDMMIGGGGTRTQEVVMRKRSENRGYYDENVRDSIVMGDMHSGFTDSHALPGSLGYSGSQSLYGFSLAQSSRARTQSEDINDALLNLDRVLQDSRMTPGVPETPTRLVFSALGPTALKVSWQEPHCERDVLGYCVLYQLLNGGEMKRIEVPNPSDNSVVVQDLLPNQSYLFKVKAQSQVGWGPEREGVITIESAVDPRSPLSPMPGSPFTLSTPSAPGPLVFTALSPEALQLSWDKPRKPNGDILGYVVTCEQLHGGGDVRTFQVSGDNSETSLTVPDLSENMPYKFKVQARTTQGFGPEREGIITIESQDGGTMSHFSDQGMHSTMREVFQMPTEVSTRTNVSHTSFNEPYFSTDGMMMSSQRTETSGMVTRHVTKEVVQRSMVAGSSLTKKVERFYEA